MKYLILENTACKWEAEIITKISPKQMTVLLTTVQHRLVSESEADREPHGNKRWRSLVAFINHLFLAEGKDEVLFLPFLTTMYEVCPSFSLYFYGKNQEHYNSRENFHDISKGEKTF